MLAYPQPPRIHLARGSQRCIQKSWRYRHFNTQHAKDICYSLTEQRCSNHGCSAFIGPCFCEDNREGICGICEE